MYAQCRNPRQCRKGTTVVETAVILPVFLTFLLAIFEFGHAQMVNNMLNSACRKAARVGSVEGTTSADVVARIDQIMSTVVDPQKVSVYVVDASIYDSGGDPPTTAEGLESLPAIEVAVADPRQLFVVRARVNYNDIAIIPFPLLKDAALSSQAFIRHE